MGRASQFFWYINMPEAPTEMEKRHIFTSLDITDDIKKIRMQYRRDLKKEDEQIELFRQ